MDSVYDLPLLEALVRRVFNIEAITSGNPEKDFIVRYHGRLLSEDSEAAYDQLVSVLAPYHITPLFRWDGDRHAIFLVRSQPQPKPSNPWINLILLVITFFSITIIGGLNEVQLVDGGFNSLLVNFALILWGGMPFAFSLLAILGAHEMGHYLMCRKYGVAATLPYFIPFPTFLGTAGAVIVMKEQPKNRRQLLDIGLAGPLAGLLVTIPILVLGLSLSKLDPIPTQIPSGMAFTMEGSSILYLLIKYIMFGQLLPAPANFGGLPEWLYWIRYFFTGHPYPLGGLDVLIHPVALAGWAGILVTALNLIPAGQLDGGHAMYVLIGGKRMAKLFPFVVGAVMLLGIVSPSWWLWAALLFFFGRKVDDPADQITPLDQSRRWLAVIAIIIFFLVLTPVPLSIISGM